MASLSNANKSFQRLHRERQQPQSRKHLGFLEKKKDYKLRANDYNEKQKTLKKLRKKALDKNPNEFFFHMVNSQLKNGQHFEKNKDEYTADQLKLMQTQDLKYIALKRNIELKKIQKLKATLHLIDVQSKPLNKHTFFTDTKKEAKKANPVKKLNTHPELIDSVYNLPKLDDLKNEDYVDEKVLRLLPTVERERDKAYSELVKRIEREKQLKILMDKMLVKSQLMSNSKATKEKEGTVSAAPVYKWPKERKK
ncbi:putative U3 small nucleolar RNA-associated protein 11-like protein [Dinothrombium tinctorium]|uniref:U3 small nucleolar RNA-associated protein 11 n=1 Tax=Dinothrombium tinctorium TaxID=1965070 RepID=A0A3S3P123_9ACAR|nr:putative U3 small nucleolar RNA-associated protein 11-like protein [Dinothrombium tinctorium]RWS02747.1 putative U3 small nucleolar RNA-associated protein 11-like protein [Dinothrombium tinctorium]RWS16709.1 putative U3 small nucleolar RNA-associated protein 11-like protein [Dinothrombium tinctorium]RWS16744.1 putative U3 small nucleolar RNA-associated protein 11-like protein [Dinothrombium tinctorium]